MALSVSRSEAAQIAWNLAVQGYAEDEVKVLVADVESMIDTAAKMVCDQVANSPQYYYLQVTLGISSTGGGPKQPAIAQLPSDFIAPTIHPSRGGEVSLSTGQPLLYVPQIVDLTLPKPTVGYYYYTIRGGNASGAQILTADEYGNGANLSLLIRGCEYFPFALLPAQLEDEFILTLRDLVIRKMRSEAPLPSAQAPAQAQPTGIV